MNGTSYPEALGQGHSEHGAEHRDDFGAKLGMWLFLVTEIILFGGLFIGYSYMRANYPGEFHHAGSELNATIASSTRSSSSPGLTMIWPRGRPAGDGRTSSSRPRSSGRRFSRNKG
jgi:heme/copper-type cytochrome/quinol oxidase subunit 3